jgi:hypothetical protein
MLLAPLTTAQIIITDHATPIATLDELRELGIQVIQA